MPPSIHDYWHPRIAAEFNGLCLKLAKLKGRFIWHHHETEDELFPVQYAARTADVNTCACQSGLTAR